VNIAKQKYQIEIYNPYLSADTQKGLQIKLTNFESELKDSLSATKLAVQSQLPKIEESIGEYNSRRHLHNRISRSFPKLPHSQHQPYLDNSEEHTKADSQVPKQLIEKLRSHKKNETMSRTLI
jgi:hypothetical protein